MNFDFSDDQKLLKDQARKFLGSECTTRVVRRVLESDEPYAAEVWNGLVELGFTATTIPEKYGGLGLGYLELCVIAEELGRALAPVPFSSSVYLATEALLLAGSEAQKKAWLPRLASGAAKGTFAIAEGAGTADASGIKAAFADGKLTGTKVPVPDGDVADFAVVLARTAKGAGAKALSLALVDLGAKGVKRTPVQTLDPSRSHASIAFKGAKAELLGKRGAGAELCARILDRAAILFSFEQIGGADAALEMATAYAKQRIAFGRPIGSFQAIKHKLAHMYIKNTLARSHAYYGAWALSANAKELPLAAAGARVAASEAFDYAGKENNQTHGGMGYTWEMDCQLYYRRARLLALTLGPVDGWKARLVGALAA